MNIEDDAFLHSLPCDNCRILEDWNAWLQTVKNKNLQMNYCYQFIWTGQLMSLVDINQE